MHRKEIDKVQAFEIILLALMRNDERVANAMRALNVHESALAMATTIAKRADLIIIRLEAYGNHPYLGFPLRVDPGFHTMKRTVKAYYRLPLWPEFALEVQVGRSLLVNGCYPSTSSDIEQRLLADFRRDALVPEDVPTGYDIDFTDYVVHGMRFVRPAGSMRPLTPAEIAPWKIVLDDLDQICESKVDVDSWFPTKDFVCVLRDLPG